MKTELIKILDRVKTRSRDARCRYLARMEEAHQQGPGRNQLSCGNLAHGFAACHADDKKAMVDTNRKNIAIISAYNDILSAHQPFQGFPSIIKEALHEKGAQGQFAGGVPAMCDGVTQGQDGMDLSLFSRDTIAMSTAIALSHNLFDGTICLGVCDKIVPGMLIGALSFGYLPTIFIPAGPMESGLPNKDKALARERFSKGEIDRETLLRSEAKSYHSPGTCTFYGTANSNQMLMEFMGLHLPGSSFVNPSDPMRPALTSFAAQHLIDNIKPLYKIISEESILNGLIGLLATGGSTNLTIHMVAIAKAAGILINWDDISDLSGQIPLLARIYPNGSADVNHFHSAGGLGLIVKQLLEGGLLFNSVETVVGCGMENYTREPVFDGEGSSVRWREGAVMSGDLEIIASVNKPFSSQGGLTLMKGNLGRAFFKNAAVAKEHLQIEAEAVVFEDQHSMKQAFENGDLHKDCIVVVRNQGPKANGMPELHKLTPILGVLQDLGYKVALLTDGRMSGASGKVPAAIHLHPEAKDGGLIAKVKNGDLIRFDGIGGELKLLVSEDELSRREPVIGLDNIQFGLGRELFTAFREKVSHSEGGATIFNASEA